MWLAGKTLRVSDWVTESVPPRSPVGHTHTKEWVRPAMPEPPRRDDMACIVGPDSATSTEHGHKRHCQRAARGCQSAQEEAATRLGGPFPLCPATCQPAFGADRRQGFPEPRCATQFSPTPPNCHSRHRRITGSSYAHCPPTPPRLLVRQETAPAQTTLLGLLCPPRRARLRTAPLSLWTQSRRPRPDLRAEL